MKNKKKVIGLCAILLLATGCGKVPTLENGEDAIVSFENGDMISVNDFYDRIKDNFGLETLITMVDTYICETEFADYKETAQENAQAYIDAWIEQYGGEDEFLSVLQQQTSYQTIDAYKEYLYLSYLQSHAIEEYAKTKITDKEIEKYYEDEAIGDMDISHILITPDVDDDATDEEITTAEEKAKETINEIIKKLNTAKKNGEDITETFSSLAKEYSEDEATKDDGGSLGKINYGDLSDSYDELIDAAVKLKDGEYSTEVITTELGYHVILKTKTYEKDTLENLKEEIIKTLADRYIEENQNSIGLTALQHYRKEYGMEIEDEEMQKQYSNYIQNAIASIQSSNTEE